ncbi:MAG: methyltransferase domain-containing protein [Chitinophagaceae bacterium]
MKSPKYLHTTIEHNLQAPNEIVPFLIQAFHPKSVVDVGCGLGTFLNIFLQNGVEDIAGVDGAWVDKSKLFIPSKYFITADLECPLDFQRKFDLVICLEVAEHLEETFANVLVDNLCALGDIIIFSSAIKNQGGQNHINEQPFTYWVEKFKQKGFIFYDVFRTKFWNNASVNWWYKQNMFLVMKDLIPVETFFPGAKPVTDIQEYIHPELFKMQSGNLNMLKQQLKKIKEGEMSAAFYFQRFKKALKRKFIKK